MIFDLSAGAGDPYKVPVLSPNYPEDASLEFNKNVTCKVAIETPGSPALCSYQWYKNGEAVEGATGDTYTFQPLVVGSVEVYCRVTNEAGTVTSRTAVITGKEVYLFKDGTINPEFYNDTLKWTSLFYVHEGVKMNIQDKNTGRKFNAMDITNVNRAEATITGSWGGNFNFVLYNLSGGEVAKVSGKTVGQVLTLDLSAFTGEYVLGFYATSGHSNGNFNVNVNPIAIYP